MRKQLAVAALAFLSMISQSCGAILTFEKESGLYITNDGFTFQDNGFEFVFGTGSSGEGSGPAALIGEPGVNIICSPPCSSDGSSAYYSLNGASLTMSKIDSSPFSLVTIDAAQVFTTLDFSLELSIIGELEGGGVVTTVLSTAPGGADTFAKYSLPSSFTNLLSVEFVGGNIYPENEFAIDNIVVIPEPSTWAMMGIGFIGLGFLGSRRARSGARRAFCYVIPRLGKTIS